jgi:hypothetical protein
MHHNLIDPALCTITGTGGCDAFFKDPSSDRDPNISLIFALKFEEVQEESL